MTRAFTLAVVWFAACAFDAPAEETSYHIIFKNTSGQISLPDEVGRNKKTYFIDLIKVGQPPHQMFGGTGDRFRVVEYQQFANPPALVCEEVAKRTRFVLELDVPFDLARKPQGAAEKDRKQ